MVTPDAVAADQATVDAQYYSLGLYSGALMIPHALPSYNAGLAPITLEYSSTATDIRGIFVEPFQIDPTQSQEPSSVQARLTLANPNPSPVPGPTVTYDTTQLNPGDLLDVSLQETAAQLQPSGYPNGIPTGRYAYSITNWVTSSRLPPAPLIPTRAAEALAASTGVLAPVLVEACIFRPTVVWRCSWAAPCPATPPWKGAASTTTLAR